MPPDSLPTSIQPTPEYVRKILARHRAFGLAAAVALAGLFAEEAVAAPQLWGQGTAPDAWLLFGGIAVLLALAGNAAAFLLPPMLVRPEDFPRPVGAFAASAALGIAFSVVANAAALLFLLLLVTGLDAVAILLKDVYLFTLMAVLCHILLYYVRHMRWLYDEFGGADSPLKPIAASGGLAAAIFILTMVLLPFDVQAVNTAPIVSRGALMLHLYGRDLYLITLAIAAYAWHMRWIADH